MSKTREQPKPGRHRPGRRLPVGVARDPDRGWRERAIQWRVLPLSRIKLPLVLRSAAIR
jgi:hypothetical protein